MVFTVNSSIVKSYEILILAGKYTLHEIEGSTLPVVPNAGNLREMVALRMAQ